MYNGDYYSTQGFQQRQPAISRPRFLENFDGEHLAMCLVSAMALYAAGYVVARLFYSGIMFFLSVGLIVFLVMQVIDAVNSGVGTQRAAKYQYTYY